MYNQFFDEKINLHGSYERTVFTLKNHVNKHYERRRKVLSQALNYWSGPGGCLY